MEEQKKNKLRRYGKFVRILSGFLALVIVFSLVSGALIYVKIPSDGESSAAVNYLAENTEYVNEGSRERFADQLSLLNRAEDLESVYNEASIAIAREDYSTALQKMEQCIELYDSDFEDYVEDGTDLYQDLLLKKACLLVLLEEYDEAEAAIDDVLELNPELSDAYLVKAQILSEEGKTEELLQPLEDYLELVPQDQTIRETLAQVYFGLGNYAKALIEYQKLIDNAGEESTAEYSYLAGLSAMQLEYYALALTHLCAAKENGSQGDNLNYYLATCYMAMEQYSKAADSFTDSIEKNELKQQCYYSRSVCLLMLEDEASVTQAYEDLTKAIAYSEADADETIAQQAQELLDGVFTDASDGQQDAQEENP